MHGGTYSTVEVALRSVVTDVWSNVVVSVGVGPVMVVVVTAFQPIIVV